MYYCFLSEDITHMESDDPLIIQMEYAKKLGSLCIGNITEQTVQVCTEPQKCLAGQQVMLRCSYDNLAEGIRLLQNSGALPIEDEENVKVIENWATTQIAKRILLDVSLSSLVSDLQRPDLMDFLRNTSMVFLKSRRKGFSAVIQTSKILGRDPQVVSFLKTQSLKYGIEMILAKYYPLKIDSLGTRETRHIVLNNKIINSSRQVHSLRHIVPKSHRDKAQEVVSRICETSFFPQNYVLDLGEFIDDEGNSFLDIVEINPISCSMCYVNNSIFNTMLPCIEEQRQKLLMGYEYCYDAIQNPQRYILARSSTRTYSYISSDVYSFVD